MLQQNTRSIIYLYIIFKYYTRIILMFAVLHYCAQHFITMFLYSTKKLVVVDHRNKISKTMNNMASWHFEESS